MLKKIALILCLTFSFVSLEGKLPDLNETNVKETLNEIMKSHVTHKSLNQEIVKRALVNYLEGLDPSKSYLIEGEIERWLKPQETLTKQILIDYDCNNFCIYEQIHQKMVAAIERRNRLETEIAELGLPESVDSDEFKEPEWVKSEEELKERLLKLKFLQLDVAKKLKEEPVEKTMQRMEKRRLKHEARLITKNAEEKKKLILSRMLKSHASALDAHTTYFTPDEAEQFMINVQQRLFGIGAQLRDDINGFTVMKLLEGGPALRGKELKAEDRIIAVDGEPVVGMDIFEAVELIRGPKGTKVLLKVVRGEKEEEKTLDITITRDEVVLSETRYETSFEPYGDGVIAYLRLFSFYQDPKHSSAKDLTDELEKLKNEHNVLGVILDLRNNSGGMLTQAVDVAGLFITRGPIVSVKNEMGQVQHLRDLDGETIWNGPLVILINRASASASEIVAQTLKEYGRALVVGDDHTYGKGSFQTFTLGSQAGGGVNPKGEYKVTRGRYYTVSGDSPQLEGVPSDIVVPGFLSESEIGESFLKYPLNTDSIDSLFDDQLTDVPSPQREQILPHYRHNLQQKVALYDPFLESLTKNSNLRIENNKNYQNFLSELKKKDKTVQEDPEESFGKNDLQLQEAYSIMKDLIVMILIRNKAGQIAPQAEPVPAISLNQ